MDFNERCDWLIQYRSREKRIALLSQDNTLSAAALAERIGITPKVVEKQIAALKANGVHQRTGQGRILKKRIDFLEGAQFAACLFHCVSKIRPPIENQNSIRTGSFLLSVCCFFFLLYRLFRRSLVSAAVSLPCTDVKGERFSG